MLSLVVLSHVSRSVVMGFTEAVVGAVGRMLTVTELLSVFTVSLAKDQGNVSEGTADVALGGSERDRWFSSVTDEFWGILGPKLWLVGGLSENRGMVLGLQEKSVVELPPESVVSWLLFDGPIREELLAL